MQLKGCLRSYTSRTSLNESHEAVESLLVHGLRQEVG